MLLQWVMVGCMMSPVEKAGKTAITNTTKIHSKSNAKRLEKGQQDITKRYGLL